MTAIDHAIGLFGLSCGFWMIFGLITGLSIQRFIVKRYEKETDLSQTMYFSQFMPFAKYLPDFFSSPLYMGHLLSFVWGWKYVKFVKEKRKKIKYYDDINSPEEVIRHFSKKEIRRVKWFAIIGFIVILHAIVYYALDSFWPDVLE